MYHKLSYIDRPVGDDDIRALLRDNSQQITIDGTMQEYNVEALNEMSRFIADKTAQHFKVSMKSLMERFTKAPYGCSVACCKAVPQGRDFPDSEQ